MAQLAKTARSFPRKERRDAAKHRQRILAEAQRLFAAQSVDATSMAQIARAAGIGQGTLYRRYAHKGELCGALLADNMQRFQATVDAHLAASSVAALDQLADLLERLVAFNEANAPLLGAIGDAACGSRRADAFRSPLYLWLRATSVALLRRARVQGEIGQLDIEATVDALLAPLAIDVYLHQRQELGLAPQRIVAALRQLLFDGLRPREATCPTDD